MSLDCGIGTVGDGKLADRARDVVPSTLNQPLEIGFSHGEQEGRGEPLFLGNLDRRASLEERLQIRERLVVLAAISPGDQRDHRRESLGLRLTLFVSNVSAGGRLGRVEEPPGNGHVEDRPIGCLRLHAGQSSRQGSHIEEFAAVELVRLLPVVGVQLGKRAELVLAALLRQPPRRPARQVRSDTRRIGQKISWTLSLHFRGPLWQASIRCVQSNDGFSPRQSLSRFASGPSPADPRSSRDQRKPRFTLYNR